MQTKPFQGTPRSLMRIPFHDCDLLGHLNNTRYLAHFIDARTSHLREFYGYDVYTEAAETGRNWFVQGTQIRYVVPARLNDLVAIETRLLRSQRHRLLPEAVMLHAETGRLLAAAWVNLAYVDTSTGRPVRHDEELTAFVSSIVDTDPSIERDDFRKRVDDLRGIHDGRRERKIAS